MNKDRAINILVAHAKKYNDPHYKADVQGLTANNLDRRFKPQENPETGELEPHGMVEAYTNLLNILIIFSSIINLNFAGFIIHA